MPDETRVFDVTRPSHVNPPATSKPVIVGHQPQASDPMVKDGDIHFGTEKPEPQTTKIQIMDDSLGSGSEHSQPAEPADNSHPEPVAFPAGHHQTVEPPAAHTEDDTSPAIFSEPEPEGQAAGPPATPPEPMPAATPQADLPPESTAPAMPQEQATEPVQPGHIESLHFSQPPSGGGTMKFILPLILLLLAGAYLAIDAGLIGGGINLPFHIFKQESKDTNPAPAVQAPAPKQQPVTSTAPAGFKIYQLADTVVAFAAPTAWGDPTSTNEQGYSERGGTNKPDGVHAYLVSFAKNKDIQLAVTSSKFLPPARAAQYYDYLQWCTGTNDGKFYQSTLHFATENKVDSPSTITCDQGPLLDTEKIDSKTIVQSKAKTGTNILGDVYTKNLDDRELVVFRVLDKAMTNGDDIKNLLGTVKTAEH